MFNYYTLHLTWVVGVGLFMSFFMRRGLGGGEGCSIIRTNIYQVLGVGGGGKGCLIIRANIFIKSGGGEWGKVV